VFSIAPANYDAVPAIASRYRAKHGTFMPHEALMYGAALQHMVAAVELAKSVEPGKIRDAITSVRKCDGFAAGLPGGCTSFDDKGLTNTAFPIFVQWTAAGELVTVHPTAVAKGKPN
jgi:branched-chain amino acid transport system substrate-binding protein